MSKRESEIEKMNHDSEESYNSIKRLRANAKRKFTRKCNALQDLCRNNEHILVIKEKFDDVRESYKELDASNDRLLNVINRTASHGTMNSLLDECDTYMKEVDAMLDQMRGIYAQRLPEHACKRSEVHVKPLDSPRFSGDIRQYSSFRQDFNRLMTSHYGKDAYALRSCLSGSALNAVKGVEDDFDEMFHRLDNMYGDPRKFVDSVVQELKTLKPIAEGDTKHFLSAVNVIEHCWLDLKRMNLVNEMNTVTIVSMIERLMPPTQKREWILKMDSRDHASKNNMFEELLQYLLQEKRVIEYMEHDVRIIGKSRHVNHTAGNAINNVSAESTEELRDMGKIEKRKSMIVHANDKLLTTWNE